MHIIAVGTKMPAWISRGYDEYAKRVRGRCKLHLSEVAAERRGKRADIAQVVAREATKLMRAVPPDSRVIAMHRDGRVQSSRAVSQRLEEWMRDGRRVSLLIGGADGLSPRILQDADEVWSLSALTLPHSLARVLLAEQIYRACSLLEGAPYHR